MPEFVLGMDRMDDMGCINEVYELDHKIGRE